jgi:two-component system OmpR family response regulator
VARLLIVDDEADLLALAARQLTDAGHTVALAGDGGLALALVEQHGMPDAAILDVAMPGIDGFALLQELRRRDPRLPIAFLTVLWNDELRSRAESVSALFVEKPATAADLRSTVRQLLTQSGDPVSSGGQT